VDNDEHVAIDDTLLALLRKQEDGTFSNKAGAQVRALLVQLRALADKTGNSVAGEVTLKIKVRMSGKGHALVKAECATKAPKLAPVETVAFIDEDGDLISRPVEKQRQLTIAGTGPVADIEQQRKASV
jgi:hypothetical protein